MSEQIDISDWPDCPIQGCPNKICLRLKSQYCFPHTKAGPFDKMLAAINSDTSLCFSDASCQEDKSHYIYMSHPNTIEKTE